MKFIQTKNLLIIIGIILLNSNMAMAQNPAITTIGIKEAAGLITTTHHFKISNDGENIYDFLDQKDHFIFQTKKENDPKSTIFSFNNPMTVKGNLYPNSKSRALTAIDNGLVLLTKSETSDMDSYNFYDLQKQSIVMPLVFMKNSNGMTGKIISFKRKTGDAIMVTALYSDSKANSMMVKSWFIKPNLVAGINMPALLGPGDVSENVLFSYTVEKTNELEITGADCSEDGSYGALSFKTNSSDKDSKIYTWNRATKTWSTSKFTFKFKMVYDVANLSFNTDGYLSAYFEISGRGDNYFVINPVTAKTVFSQEILVIGSFDENLVISKNGGLYAMVEYSGKDLIKGQTKITVHKMKSNKVLATLVLPDDSKRALQRGLSSISGKYEFYDSDNGIQAIDATPDFKSLAVLSIYSDIVKGNSESGLQYNPLNQYYDIYDLSYLMKEDDLELKPLKVQ
ncbi:MAG: hypothetical protein ABIW38_15655 [Ferruginibacter sp.]